MPAADFNALSDPDLIAACLEAGNGQAWEALIFRYQRLIYSIPLRYGFSQPDAADVFQAVCVLLLENLARLRNRQRLGAWLVITTRRECWRLARQGRQTLGGLETPAIEKLLTDDSQVDEDLVDLEGQTVLRTALDCLEPRCQQLLTLLFYTDPRPPYDDIVKTLALPPGSIGPTRARCLEKLTRILERMGYFE
jgi:RNA polymerase sigma factor (sigma-70 family)